MTSIDRYIKLSSLLTWLDWRHNIQLENIRGGGYLPNNLILQYVRTPYTCRALFDRTVRTRFTSGPAWSDVNTFRLSDLLYFIFDNATAIMHIISRSVYTFRFRLLSCEPISFKHIMCKSVVETCMWTILTVVPRIPRYIRGIGVWIKINTAVGMGMGSTLITTPRWWVYHNTTVAVVENI